MPSKMFSVLFGFVAAAASVLHVACGASFASSPSANSATSQISPSASSLYASSGAPQTVSSASHSAVHSTSPAAADELGCDLHNAEPLFRAFNAAKSDHYYTTDLKGMMDAVHDDGYEYEGTAGHVFRLPSAGTTQLYRAFSPYDHFYTISRDELDSAIQNGTYVSDGTEAYVYATPICGSIPFYQLYDPELQDNLYTTNATERDDAMDNGYTYVGIACYIVPDLHGN